MANILLEKSDQIAVVTLNRPERMNAISYDLRAELIQTLTELNSASDVRVVIITGAGDKAFSAGQDLEEAQKVGIEDLDSWLTMQRNMYQAVRDLSMPCIAALNGVAAGAGFQISLCADFRYASPTIRIGQPEVKAGLASIVGSYLMTQFVGTTLNKRLSMYGDLISGALAYENGIITELTDENVLSYSMSKAKQLAALPSTALRLTKEQFRVLTQPGFDQACIAGIVAQKKCYESGEPQQVMSEFLNARKARVK